MRFSSARMTVSLLALGSLAACEVSSGDYTHASAPGVVTAELTASVAGDPATTRTYSVERVHACRGGLISLSIGPGSSESWREHAALESLYLKPPRSFHGAGSFPVRYERGTWMSPWSVDGTVALDVARGIAPFGLGEGGTVEGTVTIVSDTTSSGTRTLAGRIEAQVVGDTLHTVDIKAKFAATYRDTDGCPAI